MGWALIPIDLIETIELHVEVLGIHRFAGGNSSEVDEVAELTITGEIVELLQAKAIDVENVVAVAAMEVELTGVGVNELGCIAAHGEHVIAGAAEGLDIAAYTIVSRIKGITNEDSECITASPAL